LVIQLSDLLALIVDLRSEVSDADVVAVRGLSFVSSSEQRASDAPEC